MKDKLMEMIRQQPEGTAFTAKDFLNLGDYDTVRKALMRLSDDGTIRRVMRGIYDKPYFSEIVKAYRAPKIDKIAEALARNYQWTIAPSGATAANVLGLSTQIPVHWSYISDGPYRDYEIGQQKLSFSHRNNRSITSISRKTATVIEALKYLGKGQIRDEDIRSLSALLTENEKEDLLAESVRTSQWIHDSILRIAGKKV